MPVNFNPNVASDLSVSALQAAEAKAEALAEAADELPEAKTLTQLSEGLPALAEPKSAASTAVLGAVPSLGASVLALTTELADQQRRANNEQRIQQSKAIVENIHAQADEIRDTAVANLVMGLVSSGIQAASAGFQIGASASALKATSTIADANLRGATLAAMNARNTGITEGLKGLTTGLSSVNEFVSATSSAALKDQEAEVEAMRAYLAQLDSLNDALKEVIQKAISNQDAIQQSTNQTRTKILS